MELVFSEQVDKQQWDALVRASGGTVFSLSAYLDATADHWAILYTDDKTEGIVCPFSVKLGVRVLYAPFFHRYSEWIGDHPPALETLVAALKEYFPVADAQLRREDESGDRVHQIVVNTHYKPNQQAKRMLKKAAGFSISAGLQKDELMRLLKSELSPRVAAIDDHSLELLDKLVSSFGTEQLVQLNLLENEQWCGGIWLLVFNERVLYLKGTVSKAAKDKGGMYLLLEHAIQLAFEEKKLFDFGGSNVEGVRRFNLNWGASDVAYRHLEWNNAPLWWKTLKSLRKTWRKKSS